MAEQPYWNPRHETMPREELTALQVHKLRRLVEWADASVPWHSKRLRDAGVTADQIHSIDDLRRIPFLTRDEWMNAQQDHPPFGVILAAPEGIFWRARDRFSSSSLRTTRISRRARR